MIEALEFISKIILILLGFWSLHRVWATIYRPSFIAPIFIVYLMFFWLPILLDIILGIPIYDFKFQGFQQASQDNATSLIYNIYTSFIIILFLRRLDKYRFRLSHNEILVTLQKIKHNRKYLYILSILPIFLLLFVDNPMMYLVYRAINPDYEIPDGPINGLLMNSTLIAGITGPILLFTVEKRTYSRLNKMLKILFLLFITFMAAYLNGKRFIIPIIIICYGSLHYYYGIKNKIKLLFILSIVISLFVGFILFYGKNLGGDWNEIYSRMRIDFGRDDVTKYTIYETFIRGGNILEYNFQSFLFNMTFFIPRNIWPDKPLPYAVYLTSSLLGYREVRMLGWSMTTSIFEESLANLRIIGFFFPFFYMHIIKKINNINMIPRFLGMMLVLMLIVVQFSAMNALFILFVITLLKSTPNK